MRSFSAMKSWVRPAAAAVLLSGLLSCAAAPVRTVSTESAKPAISAESLAAAQALKLMGAVQIAHFTSAGRYAAVADLKKKELLDPEWPRVSTEHYRITCELPNDLGKFVCHADALRAGDPWFRIDDSQKLLTEPSRRPTEGSPGYHLPKTGGKL